MIYKASITAEEIEKLELAHFTGEIEFIDRVGERFDRAVEVLSKERVIGFDTETKPSFHAGDKKNRVALLQLSAGEEAFIFRLKSIELPESLANLLANPSVLKIGAAVHDDIRGLQYYNKFTPKGFIDLQSIVSKYGIEEKSVRKMSAIILGMRISKSQQLSNWESEHLTSAQINYAALDAWVCREMYIRLKSLDKKRKRVKVADEQ